jgi:hypothetical protein
MHRIHPNKISAPYTTLHNNEDLLENCVVVYYLGQKLHEKQGIKYRRATFEQARCLKQLLVSGSRLLPWPQASHVR